MKKSTIKVLYLTNIPSPYMVGYLNELAKYVELNVVFEKDKDTSRPQMWNNLLDDALFEYTILKGITVGAAFYGDYVGSAPDDKAMSFDVCKYINANYDFIISANPCTPTGIIAIAYMRLHRIKYSIQSEGGFPGKGNGIKERIKWLLMHKADYFFSTCDMDDMYFMKYGATRDRIRRYPFSSLRENDIPKSIISDKSKDSLKKELELHDDKIILYVGRNVYVKGIDVLLKAYNGIFNEASLYCVGGEYKPEYDSILSIETKAKCHFVSQVRFEELKNYYQIADVLVLPTRNDTWGLVVNEAMAFGLPVITTDMCVAGNALIENDVNGFIVKTENSNELREAILKVLKDEDLQNKMRHNNLKKIQGWTIENMGLIIYQHIAEIKQQR